MVILGISAYYHDSAAAIIVDGKIVYAVLEERLNREKHYKKFPQMACTQCLSETGLTISDIDIVVFYEKPFLKFERLLRSHITYAPKGLVSFVKSMPIWLKERLNLRSAIAKELKNLFGDKPKEILFSHHHLSHAANACFTSPFESCAVLVIDAVGEYASTSIYDFRSNTITLKEQLDYPNSIGLLYSSFTFFLGFNVNSDEYKVMGLAAYGDKNHEETRKFIDIILSELIDLHPDGSFTINERYFCYMYSLKMVDDNVWASLFGIECRDKGTQITTHHNNLACAIQCVVEEICLRLAKHAKEITGLENLCISGGCALNCAAIGVIKQSRIFANVFVPFAPGDDGAAIGAALAVSSLYRPVPKVNVNPYLGRSFTNGEMLEALKTSGLRYDILSYTQLYEKLASILSQNMIVGWMQGRMEFGPRALGNRSILADARQASMKDKINASVKFREAFRPFAPVVLKEDAFNVFALDEESPYMMSTYSVPSNAYKATTHANNTARIQTVSKETNDKLYDLLKAYKNQTGCSVLLNTSFNVMGEPIVSSPKDAIHTFLNSGIDILVMNNIIVYK